MIPKLKRTSLANEIAGNLRRSIDDGTLTPGTRLVELELSGQMGVSRGPLREALRILESEGLIESSPNRGCFVASFSEEDIAEFYSLRIILEREAAQLAAANASDAQKARLKEILADLLQAAEKKDITRVVDLDLDFHRQVWVMAGHRRLKQILDSTCSQIRMYVFAQTRLYPDLPTGISDHIEIYESIMNSSGELAARLIESHLSTAAQDIQSSVHKEKEVV